MSRRRPLSRTPHSALRRSPAFQLRFVAERMRSRVDEALTNHGLSWTECAALVVLCEVSGLSQQGLAERTAVDRSRISQALTRLEERELVERSTGVDRRHRLVHVTDTGRARLRAATGAVERAEREALLPLDPRERDRLAALLAKLIPPDRVGIWALLPEWGR